MEWKHHKPFKVESGQSKPMEIYVFIDPFCEDCWALSPIIKKLQLEYGDYFTLKHVLSGNLTVLNSARARKRPPARKYLTFDQGMAIPHLAAISIKAAELQGKNAGSRFLRRLQELLFSEHADIADINTLEDCAGSVGLDSKEFIRDIYSSSASRAFQTDMKITAEMQVNELPTLVFFNDQIEDEGLKITGLYSYDIYVQILKEMLGGYVEANTIPPLERYLAVNRIVSTHDLAIIYDMPFQQVEFKMKKLQLQRKVEKSVTTNGSLWRYTSHS